MEILIIAQTIFYLTVSLAIIVAGILGGITAYYLIYVARHLRNISDNLENASEGIKNNVKEIMDRLSQSPLLSFLFRGNYLPEKSKKGRK